MQGTDINLCHKTVYLRDCWDLMVKTCGQVDKWERSVQPDMRLILTFFFFFFGDISFLQALLSGLREQSTRRKHLLSTEELEARRKKRQEAAAKRARLMEERRKAKAEAEHVKKYGFHCISYF